MGRTSLAEHWPAITFATLALPSIVLAQEGDAPLLDVPPGTLEQSDPNPGITDEGVPKEPVDAADGVAEVEAVIGEVEQEIRNGLPDEFVIKFGDTNDWIQLKSGEWLKGRLKRMREDEIEFDSDELDDLKFGWSKVVAVHCPGVNTYVFSGAVDVVGRGVVTSDTVLVETSNGIQRYPRGELLSIVEGPPRERNWWSAKLGAGFSANAGNTNQGSVNAYFQLRRADYRTRTLLRYDGTVGYADREENVNRHIGEASVRLYLSKIWFVTPFTVQLLNDRFQNTRFRAQPAAGTGAYIFKTKKWKWDFSAGLGYQYIDFLSVTAGIKNPQSDGFVLLGTWAKLEPHEDIEIVLDWTTTLVYTTVGNTNHIGEVDFSADVADMFDIEIRFTFLRTEDPVVRANDTAPSKNDYQLIVGLGLEFD